MTFKELLDRVENSVVFKKFKEQYPDAVLCAGFFILDFLSNDEKRTLDYMIDSKVFTFSVAKNDDITIEEDKLMDIPNTPKLKEIKPVVGVEVDELKSIAGIRARDEGISAKMHKIIAVLQKYKKDETSEEVQVWNLTCMFEQLIIANVIVDSDSGDILKFERKYMMDMIRKK